MKWTVLLPLALTLLFSLTACGSKGTVLKDPPALKVSAGEQEVEALRGTTSWSYCVHGDRWEGYEADCLSAVDKAAKELVPVLKYAPVPSDGKEVTYAFLSFAEAPDRVTVRCWDETAWEEIDPYDKGENVSVREKDLAVPLKESGTIYEVYAAWDSASLYNGNVYYSFYAVPGE